MLFGLTIEQDFLKLERKLSPRLIEVLEMVAEGYDELEIVRRQGVSVTTIKHQMTILYDRLGLTDKRTKGRNNRVMLAWWWRNVGKNLAGNSRVIQMASTHSYRLCKICGSAHGRSKCPVADLNAKQDFESAMRAHGMIDIGLGPTA